jgi:hypothetical protein
MWGRELSVGPRRRGTAHSISAGHKTANRPVVGRKRRTVALPSTTRILQGVRCILCHTRPHRPGTDPPGGIESTMSDVSQGPGWRQASDPKWYPPEKRPDPAALPPPPVTPPQPNAKTNYQTSQRKVPFSQRKVLFGQRKVSLVLVLLVFASCLLLGVALVIFLPQHQLNIFRLVWVAIMSVGFAVSSLQKYRKGMAGRAVINAIFAVALATIPAVAFAIMLFHH